LTNPIIREKLTMEPRYCEGRVVHMVRKRKINPISIRLLSVQDVATKFKFHPNTIYKWVNEDNLRCYRGPRDKIFLREDDVVDFLLRIYGVENAVEDDDDG